MASYRPYLATSLLCVAFACSSPSTTEEQTTVPEPEVVNQPVPLTTNPTAQVQPQVLHEAAGKHIRNARQEIGLLASADAAHSVHHLVRPAPYYHTPDRENYQEIESNGVMWVSRDPVSTFSVDVDSAAYANMRRQLNLGQRPDPDSIRIEELINYFTYDYPKARNSDTPFSVYTEMGPSPWHAERKLV